MFKTIIDQYTSGQDTTLRNLIDQFVAAEANLQQVSNPSGTVSTGGLGEPKFNIDETAFTGAWGRPQRGIIHPYNTAIHLMTCLTLDGPALRATAIINYANWLIANGNSSWVTSKLWPIIKLDLDYVSVNWNQTT